MGILETDRIPDVLPLQKAIALQNDPTQLEDKDFEDFIATLNFPLASFLGRQLYQSTLQFAKVIQDGFESKKDHPDHFWLLKAATDAVDFAKGLEHPLKEIDDGDIFILDEYFGGEAGNIVAVMQERWLALRQGLPSVYNHSEKFGEVKQYQDVVQWSVDLVPVWFGQSGERLGISVPFPEKPTGSVLIEDATPLELEPYVGGENSESEEKVAAGSFHFEEGGFISLSAEFLMLLGLTNLKHETNHLWLYHVLNTPDRYDGVTYIRFPEWFREGMAVYFADEISDKRFDSISFKSPRVVARQWTADPFSMEHFVEKPRDYYAAGLAIEVITEKYGEKILGRIIEETNSTSQVGEAFQEALAAVIPDWASESQFFEDIQRASLQKIMRQDSDEAREDYIRVLETVIPEARHAYESEDPKEVVYGLAAEAIATKNRYQDDTETLERYQEVFEGFLEKYPESSFSPAVRYLLGLTFVRLARGEEALPHFQSLIHHPERFSTFMEGAIYLEASIRAERAKEVAILEEASKLLTDPMVRGWAYDAIKNFGMRDHQESPEESGGESGCVCSLPRPTPLQGSWINKFSLFFRRR